MGHKVDPRGLRIGITRTWTSRWFASKRLFPTRLREDVEIRDEVMRRCKAAGIDRIDITRNANTVTVKIATGRPGMLIGRGGSGIEDLTTALREKFFRGKRLTLKIDIEEVRHAEGSSSLVAQKVAEQLEHRMPFRRVLKNTLDRVIQTHGVKGVKIEITGRLGGSEMARREWLSGGRIPLHTLRADIDFARATAHTTYGTIGVKVWLYKGDIFAADHAKNVTEVSTQNQTGQRRR